MGMLLGSYFYGLGTRLNVLSTMPRSSSFETASSAAIASPYEARCFSVASPMVTRPPN
jgi:hypothetical protein